MWIRNTISKWEEDLIALTVHSFHTSETIQSFVESTPSTELEVTPTTDPVPEPMPATEPEPATSFVPETKPAVQLVDTCVSGSTSGAG